MNSIILTLLIRHFHVDFSVEIILHYLTLQIKAICGSMLYLRQDDGYTILGDYETLSNGNVDIANMYILHANMWVEFTNHDSDQEKNRAPGSMITSTIFARWLITTISKLSKNPSLKIPIRNCLCNVCLVALRRPMSKFLPPSKAFGTKTQRHKKTYSYQLFTPLQ